MTTTTEDLTSSSVHPLETIGEQLQVTAGQLKLFGRDMAERESILVAFGMSAHPGLLRRASNIAFCCRSPLVYADTRGRPVLSLQTCKDRMCPRCQRARGQQVAKKVEALVTRYNAPRLLTLTLKHRGTEPLRFMLDRLARAFRTLRASPFWKRNVTRGVYTVEVTWNKERQEWHAHLHTIIDGEFMRQQEIKKLWEDITLDSTIVDIRAVHDRARQAKYISTYVAKPCDGANWDAEQLCEFALATHGRRMVHTFGKSHGKPIEAESTENKPKISSPLCSLRSLLVEAAGGCPIAARALCILPKLGNRWCLAAGIDPPSKDAETPPTTEAEEFEFVSACRSIAENIAAREAPPPDAISQKVPAKSPGRTAFLFQMQRGATRASVDSIELPV
jgi:hypothetical protein